jgi:hypothetical protein
MTRRSNAGLKSAAAGAAKAKAVFSKISNHQTPNGNLAAKYTKMAIEINSDRAV